MPVRNWLPEWLTPGDKLVAGVVDSGEKFVSSVVYSVDKLVAGVVDPCDKLVAVWFIPMTNWSPV